MLSSRLLLVALVVAVAAAPASAQRRIIGADAAPADAGPDEDDAPPPPPKKKDDKKAKPADKPKDPAKEPAKADAKRDVLDDTPAEDAKRKKDAEARAAAEKAAEAAAELEAKKKEEAAAKLAEEKKAADAKKKLENKDQRLTAAKKLRQLSRTAGDVGVAIAVEPGEVKAGSLVEVRVDLVQKVDVPDPRYGNLVPVRGAQLVATVAQPTGKTAMDAPRYVVHPLETPGRYGFHTTPPKDGLYTVRIAGTGKDGKAFEATFPLHVGVWPPPDFDDEEKNNLATTDTARGRRKVLGSN